MKKHFIIFGMLSLLGVSFNAVANSPNGDGMHMKIRKGTHDGRIALGNSLEMNQHQLANMRDHVQAVQSIIGFLSEGKFDEASKTAHSKLGLTPDMKKMCNNTNNAEFKQLGLSFHKSGDELGDVLKTKNMQESLGALQTTMSYCVQCHATYRQ